MANGKLRHVLLWGAVNANLPSATAPQVRFNYDYAGGYGKYQNGSYWKTFVKSQSGILNDPGPRQVARHPRAGLHAGVGPAVVGRVHARRQEMRA